MDERHEISKAFDEYAQYLTENGGLTACDYESFEAGWQAARAQKAGSGETDFRAEIRTERDPSDEYVSFLTLVSEGKSSPYMYIPETLDQDVLDEALRRLNTHPRASMPNLSTIAQKKLDQMGATVHGVLAKNEAGAWAAVSDAGRVMWLDGFEGQSSAATPQPAGKACQWHSDDNGSWMSECGKEWYFEDGGPEDNGMNFCVKCGKRCLELPSPPAEG